MWSFCMAGHERMQESRCLTPSSYPPHLTHPSSPQPPSPLLSSHTCQQFGRLVYFGCWKKKEHFKVNEKKESLIRLAVALRSKLLSADALQLKLAWVMSSDALRYWENNADKKINLKKKRERGKGKRNARKFRRLFYAKRTQTFKNRQMEKFLIQL